MQLIKNFVKNRTIDLKNDGWDMDELKDILTKENPFCLCNDKFSKSYRCYMVFIKEEEILTTL